MHMQMHMYMYIYIYICIQNEVTTGAFFSLLRPSESYICHQPIPSLVQIMASRLFGAKPLSRPTLYHCQWDLSEQNFSQIIFDIQTFSFQNVQLKMSSRKCPPFCPGLNVLTKSHYINQLWVYYMNILFSIIKWLAVHLWLSRKYFIIVTLVNSHCENELDDEKQSCLCKFTYINIHLYLWIILSPKNWDILTRGISLPNVH